MTQQELERQVAQATGEDVGNIRQRGFGIFELEVRLDAEPDDRDPFVVDWDANALSRNVALVDQPPSSAIAFH